MSKREAIDILQQWIADACEAASWYWQTGMRREAMVEASRVEVMVRHLAEMGAR